MSNQSGKWRNEVGKVKIVNRFYIQGYRSNYYPSGVIRLYRVTIGSTEPKKSPFMYQSVRIKNPEELAKIKPVLDYLAGKMKWKELPPLLKDLEDQLRKEKVIHPEILRIVQQYPRASIGMLKAFDTVFHDEVEIEDFPLIAEFMQTALSSLLGKQEMMINLQLKLVEKLGKEKKPLGIQKLLKLLEDYTLPQLTSVTSIITDRLQRLKVFKTQIQNENAYEIKGKNSIHNQLANALWIIDDNYWLLHSNEPLANFLKKEYRLATKKEKECPDFICASDKNDLVIVEIKRPSHVVTREDVNQIEDYLVTIDEYYNAKTGSKKGFLIGRKIPSRLKKKVEQIRNVECKTYVELVEDCERRYREYLDAMKNRTN